MWSISLPRCSSCPGIDASSFGDPAAGRRLRKSTDGVAGSPARSGLSPDRVERKAERHGVAEPLRRVPGADRERRAVDARAAFDVAAQALARKREGQRLRLARTLE